MPRIIGGRAGGRRLTVPPTGVRPTSDRVREALFSALEARGLIEDAQVLDLFAGSGALGLEALSRGASTAVLVERDPRACAVVAANATAIAPGGGALVRRASVATYLAARSRTRFDLVLVDPPYPDPVDAVVVALGGGWVAPGGVVVVERDARSPAPAWPEGLEPEEPRRYGETVLHWAVAAD